MMDWPSSMTQKESVMAAMEKDDQPAHSVDYYYLEAMRHLTCKDHDSDDSDCGCKRCCGHANDDDDDEDGEHDARSGGSDQLLACNEDSTGRERSWSHSMAENYDHDKLSSLPEINKAGGRLKTRRYSDGMILKSNMKVSNGRVQWADECKKELTRSRPRKKYERKPSLNTPPRKSILKHSSEESLPFNEDSDSN